MNVSTNEYRYFEQSLGTFCFHTYKFMTYVEASSAQVVFFSKVVMSYRSRAQYLTFHTIYIFPWNVLPTIIFSISQSLFFLNRKHCNTYTRVIFSSSDFFRNTCFPFELAHFLCKLLGHTRAYYVLLFPSDKPMQARNKQKLQRSNKPQYKKKQTKSIKYIFI